MVLLHRYQDNRGPRLFFFIISIVLNILAIVGISLLFFPDILRQPGLPVLEVTLEQTAQVTDQTTVDHQVTVATPPTAKQTGASSVAAFDKEAVVRPHQAVMDTAKTVYGDLQISAKQIHKITSEIFAAVDNRPIGFTSQIPVRSASVNSYVNTDTGVTTVSFSDSIFGRICSQYTDANPLDSFDDGNWWITSGACSAE